MNLTPSGELVLAEALTESPPPLFEQTNVRKPEYWQFARLIAPSTTLPPSKKHWTADDAAGIWCLKCHKALVFQKGSSQSIRYHMETKHRAELEAYRDHGKTADVDTSTQARVGKKRKTSDDEAESESDPTATTATNSTNANTTNANATNTNNQEVANANNSLADWTWAKNLERRGGFWGNASWYDVHVERRLPLAKTLVDELIYALPPCDNKHVLDLLAGSGRATEALVTAYPTAFVTLVDASTERLALAKQRLAKGGVRLADEQFLPAHLTPATLATASPVPVDVVMGCLALHVLAAKPPHYRPATDTGVETPVAKEALYEELFRGVWALLKPGGHFVMGDHVGQLPLFTHLRLLHEIGFVDVDCAWRKDDCFVAGGRKPLD